MSDQSPKTIDYNEVFIKLFHFYDYLKKLNLKNRAAFKYIENFTNFYKLYNILIRNVINLIKTEEIVGHLKTPQENKEKKIKKNLSIYYRNCQDLKEDIDIIKEELQAKVDKLNLERLKNNTKKLISDFKTEIEK